MAKPQLERDNDNLSVTTTEEYAPKKYSPREHATTTVTVILIVAVLLGLLWLISAMTGK